MNSKLKYLFILLLIAGGVKAQSKKISAVNNFSVRNAGTIKDINNNVDGYYFFYAVDKLKKSQLEYNIQILDNNLVEVAKKTYVDDNSTQIMGSAYNNQMMTFSMINFDKRFIKLVSFDKKANQQPIIEIPMSLDISDYYYYMTSSTDFNFLMPVENHGYLFNRMINNTKLGYAIQYHPTDGGQPWEYKSDPKSKEFLMANLLEANEKYVVFLEWSRPALLSTKIDLTTIVLDAKTGNLVFKKEYARKTNPRSVTNAMLTDNSVILMGEYFKPNDKFWADKGIGIYGEEIDLTGKTINEGLVSWDKDVDTMLKETGNSNAGYVIFHKTIRTGNGDFYAIGERYQKNAPGAGASSAVPGLPKGALLISDALFFKFDKNFKLASIEKIKKGRSRLNKFSPFASTQVNAFFAKSFGWFDYGFTQVDEKNDRFYATFLDAERIGIKPKDVKYAYKTVIYDEGELSEDNIILSSGQDAEKTLNMIPAKVGYVTLIDYDQNRKEVNVRLEKINIK